MVKSRNLVEIKMNVSLKWLKNLKRFAKRSAYYIVIILESDHWNVPVLPNNVF